jgi:spore germination protein KC
MLKKFTTLFILIAFIALTFSGCYDAREIDDELYTVAIGIDKGTSNKIRCTFQYPTYKGGGPGGSSSGGGGGGGGGGEKEDSEAAKLETPESDIQIIEAPSYLEAVDILSMSLSRRISLVHAKWIVFSEEIAREGIEGFISTFPIISSG